MIRVKGTTDSSITEETVYEEEVYNFNVIYHKGNLNIGERLTTKDESGNDINVEIDGLTKNNTTWSLGKLEDINTNTVVLKVEGDLTLNEGYTLTSIMSSGKYPKGIFIYCEGSFRNDGILSLRDCFCEALPQNLYLAKMNTGTYVTALASGGTGGFGRGKSDARAGDGGTCSLGTGRVSCGGAGGSAARGIGWAEDGGAGTCWNGGKSSSASWASAYAYRPGGGALFVSCKNLSGSGVFDVSRFESDGVMVDRVQLEELEEV